MHGYDFHIYERRRKSSRPKILFWALLIIIGIILGNILFRSPEQKKLERPLVSEMSVLAEKVGFKQNDLEPIVKDALQGAQGSYSVVIKDLKTGKSYSLNEHKVYGAGSLYKLWILATAIQQIQDGKLHDADELKSDVEAINKKFRIATESAELKTGEVSFTVASALKQMITISHNYAALLLTERVRLSNVKKFLDNNDFHESKVGVSGGVPTTTAHDTALFFEKLAKGQLANEADTERMLDLLKAQKLNNKLPKYLPLEVVVAHKTGELGFYSHDGGIVYGPKGEYIIVVLSDTLLPIGAEERIAEISKAVYHYFSE